MNVVLLDTDINPIQILLASDDYNHKLGTSDFVFILPDTIKATPHHTMRVALTSASIPVSFFNINNNNNRLDITFGGLSYSAILPFGNYNMGQFLTATDTALKAVGLVSPIGMTWNSATNKVSFTVDRTLTLESTSTCLKLIGFTEGITHSVNLRVNVNAGNNTLITQFTGSGQATDILTPGDYTQAELMTEITTKLNGNGYPRQIYSVYDTVNDKVSFRFGQSVDYIIGYDYESNTQQQVHLPTGYYSPTDLRNTFQSLFNGVNPNSLTITFDGNTGKFTFYTTSMLSLRNDSFSALSYFGFTAKTHYSVADGAGFKLVSDYRVNGETVYVQQDYYTLSVVPGSTIWTLLGFTQIATGSHDSVSLGYYSGGSYEVKGDNESSFRREQVITSNSMCDIRGYDTLHFKTDLFTAGHTYNASAKKSSNNILAQIPVDAGAYQTIQYNPNNPHLVDIKKNIVNTFRVWIEDGNGTLVDFNGMKWTATLTVYFMKTRGLIKGNSVSKWGNTSYAGTGEGNNLNSLRLYIDEITKDYKRMGQTMKIERSSLV